MKISNKDSNRPWYIKIDPKTNKAKLVLSEKPKEVIIESPIVEKKAIGFWKQLWNKLTGWFKFND